MTMHETEIQREYYTRTAANYEEMHFAIDQAHIIALHLLAAYIESDGNVRRILDVGAGTGRGLCWLQRRFPGIEVKGVEPVEALREQGYAKGIPRADLMAGDALALQFGDNSFDLVCELAVLHHVREPARVVEEMSRVARRMVAISDCNFLGQGSRLARLLKLGLFATGLWPLANWVKTRGRGYTLSKEDGLAYSYSVFQDVPILRQRWHAVHLTATEGKSDGVVPALTAAQLLVIATDKKCPQGGVPQPGKLPRHAS